MVSENPSQNLSEVVVRICGWFFGVRRTNSYRSKLKYNSNENAPEKNYNIFDFLLYNFYKFVNSSPVTRMMRNAKPYILGFLYSKSPIYYDIFSEAVGCGDIFIFLK